jgi:hypothetical protein
LYYKLVMPSIDGGDQLSPDYAPWAWIGPDNEHFVWQTSQRAEHEGFLYRAGMLNDETVVCERRPIEDVAGGSLVNRAHIEAVPIEQIPDGIFPSLQSMSDRIKEVRAAIDLIDPTKASSDQLDAAIRSKQK